MIDKELLTSTYSKLLIEDGYINHRKITIVFQFWVNLFEYAYLNNIKIEENSLNLIKNIAIAEGILLKNKPILRPTGFNKYFRKLLSLLPQKTGFLPGGACPKVERLSLRITSSKAVNLNLNVNYSLKNAFYEYAYRNGLKSNILKFIPDFFFNSQVSNISLPNVYKGYPISLLDYPYCNLLFSRNKLKVLGYQHGGGYGEIINNKIQEFEEKLCDRYYLWGLGSRNITQNRFDEVEPSSNLNTPTFFLVGTHDFAGIYSYLTGMPSDNYMELINKRFSIFHEYYKKNNIIYIANPKNKNDRFSNFRSTNLNSISIKNVNPIFILDWPFHTFFYEAIYTGKKFILFFNESWNQYFTQEYLQVLKLIRHAGLLYYWSEESSYFSRINNLVESDYPLYIFASLKNFLSNNINDV